VSGVISLSAKVKKVSVRARTIIVCVKAQAIIGRQAIELDLYKKKMVLIRQIKEK
jgi:hypothetical protein